ncbi:aldehyde dehydrogenase family protein [Cupriavidus consociatus]|uniref:aldehyde dehydrogenase family protein n=1 Tax=Cupriavidus consociatus TaxID=2821357 RepID=UPI001AE7CBC6|nr:MULTISPECIES: aldehyde dehydrogenase family protein [unclassified Cupriavidus]MBP0623166.1 aldehyde dehydrogenase family protein [Cupriavidus sp. LEh25]MDK2659860.1 aldehyde dehydrogenase family protein [Cupriavidus sp. LEh21]
MTNNLKFYIDGKWVVPEQPRLFDVVNPATEAAFAQIALGSAADVDLAVAAARRAFPSYAATTRTERLELLGAVAAVYERRKDEIADAVSNEMGAPLTLARHFQSPIGSRHFAQAIKTLQDYEFEERIGQTLVVREPIGVCGFITPWNWPMNQVACKVALALAAGCTMVLKPSEMSPISALLFAEILDEAGVPAGVFNLINGDGPSVGHAISAHPGIDMVSFTGSTRAGVLVAKTAADTVKRVSQELGGKSPNILIDDDSFKSAVIHGARVCFNNSGQSCNAPTRLLVPAHRLDEAAELARSVAEETIVGDPRAETTVIGPVANAAQFERVQAMIEKGIEEGARLVAGGAGRPSGLDKGYYVRPTVFAGVTNDMTIGREEIFGPVLSIVPYATEDQAVAIANDTVYGLSSYVTAADVEKARSIARQIRAGMVHINGAPGSFDAPFGGYKQSGNGREWGRFGFEEFLETKSMFGYEAA